MIPNSLELSNQSKSDQLWKYMEDRLTDIERIGLTGMPEDERDRWLIEAVFCAIAGDIHFKKAVRQRDEE